MEERLLDTNIISAMLKQNEKVWQKAKAIERAGKKMCLSTISYYETKRGLLATQATQKMKQFDLICQKYEMLGIDSEKVLDEASQIYANLKRRRELLPDADILIAAIAKASGSILVTNDSHFERIEGLQLENWLKED